MRRFRHLVLRNRTLAGLVLALALAMKLIVPAGFMPTISHGKFVVTICTGSGPMSIAMPGTDHDKSSDDGHGKSEVPCAFAGLSAASLAAADPVLLVAAILFVMALGIRAIGPVETSPALHLRPYLRGPPATA